MVHDADSPALELPGDDLRELMAAAEEEIVLAAPFIKVSALAGVLEHASQRVRVTCITRWRAEEVAAGVSDLAVFDVLGARAGATLLLWPRLHAKYFRADHRCLIGSANVTGRALGWVRPANVELLVGLPSTHPRLAAFEQRAITEAQPATAELRELMAEAAEGVRRERDLPPYDLCVCARRRMGRAGSWRGFDCRGNLLVANATPAVRLVPSLHREGGRPHRRRARGSDAGSFRARSPRRAVRAGVRDGDGGRSTAGADHRPH